MKIAAPLSARQLKEILTPENLSRDVSTSLLLRYLTRSFVR